MSLISVDSGACLRDGICVEACPAYVLEMPGGGDCPAVREGADQYCNRCGHCVSVCPTGTLSLSFMPVDECLETRPALLPTEEQFAELLTTRRSIRNFEDRQVPRETILTLLELVRHAPTGSNRQPVEWLVVHDSAKVRAFADMVLSWLPTSPALGTYGRNIAVAEAESLDLICRGAPHMVVAHTPKGREVDGIIAVTQLELAAYVHGLGACWGGFAGSAINGSADVRQLIGFPEGRVSSGVLLLGYPRYQHQRIPRRNALRVEWR